MRLRFSSFTPLALLLLIACAPEERDYSTGGGTCTAQADCMVCCYDTFYQQSVALDKHVYEACGCDAQATCYADCLDANTGMCSSFDTLPAACSSCLSGTVTNTDQCYQVAIGQCKGDQNCAPFYNCQGSCGN